MKMIEPQQEVECRHVRQMKLMVQDSIELMNLVDYILRLDYV